MLIINVDASCFHLRGHAGWAVSVKDNGNQVRRDAGHLLTSSSLAAEKIAIYMGLTLAPEGRRAVLQSDCKCAIEHIKRPASLIDWEIAELWKAKPMVAIKWVSRKTLWEVDALSRLAANQQHKGFCH